MPYRIIDMIPQFYSAAVCLFGAIAPTAVLTDPNISNLERYGIGGVALVVAWLFYRLWQESYRLREKEHALREQEYRKRIEVLEQELKRPR